MNHGDTEAQRKKLNELTGKVIGACIEIHRELGPGLLESAYEECLAYELTRAGLRFERQRALPVRYKEVQLDCGYRLDFVVEGVLILELKAVTELHPIHEAQVLTYLKLDKKSLGPDTPQFVSIIERHAQPLTAVASDADALTLFSSQLAPALNLSASLAPDQQQTASQLVAELAAWRLAGAVRKAADADDHAALPSLFQSITAQRNWLLGNDRFPALNRVLTFNETLQTGDPARMAHLAGLAFRAEAEAERNARLLWDRLQSWNEQLKAQKAAARLCGTWQWTIHNHKNHQEHKTAIVLLPPGTPAPPDMPQPAKMVVLGDTVYLRWDFQRGYQEDSLLFVKEGRHLEGTFMATTGDWGAITGKRIAACSK